MVTSASHQLYDKPPLARQPPWTACAAIPATATAAATGKRLRRAICSAPIVAGGEAAGDNAANTVSTAVAATGRHRVNGANTQLSTPAATSRTSSGPGERPFH